MSKYNSEKMVIDGITFDSKDEAKYYEALKVRKAKGEIQNFELQPKCRIAFYLVLSGLFIFKINKGQPLLY